MVLYHGSSKIIECPIYGEGKPYNDYGMAFYCTTEIELAKEWACQSLEQNSFVNEYNLDTAGLKILDLSEEKYNVLNWLAILIENRSFSLKSDIAKEGYKFIIENFKPEYEKYDVIKGYRADDSYFRFASAFLNNEISIQQLGKAITLGKLGMQVALKSERAFSQLVFVGKSMVNTEVYYDKRLNRDIQARTDYDEIKKAIGIDGNYLIDIIRAGWRNEDVRIQ